MIDKNCLSVKIFVLWSLCVKFWSAGIWWFIYVSWSLVIGSYLWSLLLGYPFAREGTMVYLLNPPIIPSIRMIFSIQLVWPRTFSEDGPEEGCGSHVMRDKLFLQCHYVWPLIYHDAPGGTVKLERFVRHEHHNRETFFLIRVKQRRKLRMHEILSHSLEKHAR
jgi:hypothetical protein